MKFGSQNGHLVHPVYPTPSADLSRFAPLPAKSNNYTQEMRQLIRSTHDNKENLPNPGPTMALKASGFDRNLSKNPSHKTGSNSRRAPLAFLSMQDALKPLQQTNAYVNLKGSFLKGACEANSKITLPKRPTFIPLDPHGLRTPQPKVETPSFPRPTHPQLGSLQQYISSIFSHYKTNASKNKSHSLMVPEVWRADCVQKIKIIESVFNLCTFFNLRSRTFFTANNIFDRFVNHPTTPRSQDLSLAALTAFFMAAKFEEIYPPSINDVCQALDNQFAPATVFETEGRILTLLEFNFLYVCPLDVMELIATQWNVSEPAVIQTGILLLSLFCFDDSIDGHNTLKLAIFALSVAHRLERGQPLPRGEFVLSSDDTSRFLRRMKRFLGQMDLQRVTCFDTKQKERFGRIMGFVFDKVPS
jgi:hypothetical protein